MYKPPTLYRRSFHLREASLANRLDEKRWISKLERVSRICSRAGIPFPLFPFLTSSFSPLSFPLSFSLVAESGTACLERGERASYGNLSLAV